MQYKNIIVKLNMKHIFNLVDYCSCKGASQNSVGGGYVVK